MNYKLSNLLEQLNYKMIYKLLHIIYSTKRKTIQDVNCNVNIRIKLLYKYYQYKSLQVITSQIIN